MKRRLPTIAIFLLAGAVVNVAVAWAIVAHLETLDIDWTLYESDDSEDPESFKWWTTHAPDGFASRAADVVLSSPITGASIVMASTTDLSRNVRSYAETATSLGFRGGALHSCSESSAVEPGEGQMGNVGQIE